MVAMDARLNIPFCILYSSKNVNVSILTPILRYKLLRGRLMFHYMTTGVMFSVWYVSHIYLCTHPYPIMAIFVQSECHTEHIHYALAAQDAILRPKWIYILFFIPVILDCMSGDVVLRGTDFNHSSFEQKNFRPILS